MLKQPVVSAEPQSLSDACREIGRALALDVVGVLSYGPGGRRLTWWQGSGGPTRPQRVDDVLDGRVDGWIVARGEAGAVFGRLTPRATGWARDALASVAPMLLAAEGGVLDRPLALTGSTDPGSVAEPAAEPRDEPVAPAVANALETLLRRDRARLAYEIHDGLTQSVTAAILTLEALRGRVANDPEGAEGALDEALTEVRACLNGLRTTLDRLAKGDPPASTPEESIERDATETGRRWAIDVDVSVEGALPPLPPRVAETAHVVVTEGIANAAKHAGVDLVTVHLTGSPDAIRIVVEDRGRGFSPGHVQRNGHYGLSMLHARVTEVGGELDVTSAPDRGTRVVARLPVTDEGDVT
jgi:signal transduction histidine kinase